MASAVETFELRFWVVEPSKMISLIYTIPQKEDIILLYIGYHSIPQSNTTYMRRANELITGARFPNSMLTRVALFPNVQLQ